MEVTFSISDEPRLGQYGFCYIRILIKQLQISKNITVRFEALEWIKTENSTHKTPNHRVRIYVMIESAYQGGRSAVEVPIAPVSATRAALLARLGPLVALRTRHAEAGSDPDGGGVFEENRDKHAFAERGRKNAVHYEAFREHNEDEDIHIDVEKQVAGYHNKDIKLESKNNKHINI